MEITLKKITVGELTNGYHDDGDDGVVGYGGLLDIRPPYQRGDVYNEEEKHAVIDSIMKGRPLNVMYWSVRPDGRYEVIDGQQRTISIAEYVGRKFSYKGGRLFGEHTPEDIRRKVLDYELMVYMCEGSESERLEWFKTINIAGKKLSEQELRNAIFAGPWLTDAKKDFSCSGCRAQKIASKFLPGDFKRQGYLETALEWVGNGDILGYMRKHQDDEDANKLWLKFSGIIKWAKTAFPDAPGSIVVGLDWGRLYREHNNKVQDGERNAAEIKRLVDDEVQNPKGICEFILTGDEQHLYKRTYSAETKKRIFKLQGGKCKRCGIKGPVANMEADHILPWSKGGLTTEENCQVLCKSCHRDKGEN